MPDGHLLLQTLRSHDQYNTTIYGLNDRYRGIKSGRRVVLVNPRDLERSGLADGEIVDLVGAGGRRGRAVPRRRLRHAARLRRRLLPGDQRARPARQRRGRQRDTHVEVGARATGAGPRREQPAPSRASVHFLSAGARKWTLVGNGVTAGRGAGRRARRRGARRTARRPRRR